MLVHPLYVLNHSVQHVLTHQVRILRRVGLIDLRHDHHLGVFHLVDLSQWSHDGRPYIPHHTLFLRGEHPRVTQGLAGACHQAAFVSTGFFLLISYSNLVLVIIFLGVKLFSNLLL